MRLIDANELIKMFCSECSWKVSCDNDCNYCFIRNAINNTNTAYDIDKVVEQIKNNSFTHSSVNWMFVDDLVRTEEAIDIIRNGGKE